ncbi:hypothetical protein H0A36_24175 [Endozoicomonas sp. SM1973]|uniref:Uncharacterized protein n=1 Tax=Spartinivicinus marinus TaxID=2994442 RepID=A0A853IGK6_9GAMM|nr:hypothetical protein [Spartinivicinus marinus]NYZ69121.1 hypothetical protein [Spartinivicinus marinus]
MAAPTKRSNAGDNKFFAGIEAGHGIGFAARKAGYTRSSVYHYRQEDPDFLAKWDEAKDNFKNSLGIELTYHRAIAGQKSAAAQIIEGIAEIEVTEENYLSLVKSLKESTESLIKVMTIELELSSKNVAPEKPE